MVTQIWFPNKLSPIAFMRKTAFLLLVCYVYRTHIFEGRKQNLPILYENGDCNELQSFFITKENNSRVER